jgi:hypothetical protein
MASIQTFTTTTLAAMLAAAFITSACGQKDVSFDTLELARATAKTNAEYNGQLFRASTATYANYALESQGDSAQTPNCPQGDGWATARLVNKDDPSKKVPLKCSTVSGTVGCMTAADFATKSYAADDGHCQPTTKVPFPLPKIAK